MFWYEKGHKKKNINEWILFLKMFDRNICRHRKDNNLDRTENEGKTSICHFEVDTLADMQVPTTE